MIGGILFVGDSKVMVSLTPDRITMQFKVLGTLGFPWKGIWKTKIPKRVAFFLWTAAHDRILTLDNLRLRGRILANWCCMFCCDGVSVDHLLLHCSVTHSLWTFML